MVYRKTEAGIQRAENRRSRIITAALEHMADVGWPNFDGHAVAANVKIATGTIYTYFPTMPDLVNESIGLLATMDARAMASSHPDPVERYTRAVRAVIDRSSPQRAGTKCASHPVYKAAITRALTEAIDAMGYRADAPRPAILATAVYGALFAVLADDPTPPESTRHILTTMAVRMVGAGELVS